MNVEQLHNASKKDLADRARNLGIAGYSAMRKDDLVRAIVRAMKKKAKEREKAKAKSASAAPSMNGRHHANGKPAAPAAGSAKKFKVDLKKSDPPAPAPVVNTSGKPPRHLQGGHSKDRIM